jgi:tetratricopeptide (TPR) repeat protein
MTADAKGVEVPPLRATLVIIVKAGIGNEDTRLDEQANELIRFREEIARLRRGPAQLASFAELAETLIKRGDFDGTRVALAEGRKAALREQLSHYEADFLAQGARVDHPQLAYRSAAAKYAEAARLMATFDPLDQWKYTLAQADELYRQGDEFGDNRALAEAIALYRDCLLLVPRLPRPLDWAKTQDSLGNALLMFGVREASDLNLEEAVKAYRAALQERTRTRVPLDWATTQNNLGIALSTQGERESGTERLEEAVTTFEEALKVRTRELAPLQWATTQMNLGTTLQALGERESGTARLEKAIAAFRAALKEMSRARMPLQWATVQVNLGTALRVLGERENGPKTVW